MLKNVILYILYTIIGLLFQLICMVIYPIVFLFRNKIMKFAMERLEEYPEYHTIGIKSGYKKWKVYLSPLFWGYLFTTGLTVNYSGPIWYKKKQKLKWFTKFTQDEQPIAETTKQKFQYFLLSYGWQGFRNATWALTEFFFTEGKAIDGTIKVQKCKTPDKLDDLLMPGAKFKDRDGTPMNNSGPYIRYTFDDEYKFDVTNEGVKILTFTSHKGKNRFHYGKTKILKLDFIKKFLVIELLYGWDHYDGMRYLHTKFMFKVMDDFQISEYNKYLEYLKKQ